MMKELACLMVHLETLTDGQLRYLVQAILQLLHERALPTADDSTLAQLYERGQLPGESLEQFLARIAPPEGSGFWS